MHGDRKDGVSISRVKHELKVAYELLDEKGTRITDVVLAFQDGSRTSLNHLCV